MTILTAYFLAAASLYLTLRIAEIVTAWLTAAKADRIARLDYQQARAWDAFNAKHGITPTTSPLERAAGLIEVQQEILDRLKVDTEARIAGRP